MLGIKSFRFTLIMIFAISAFANGDKASEFYSPDTDPYIESRQAMVDVQIEGRDVTDERVLKAMRTVPRHLFVPESEVKRAYTDGPLPIGHDQTISQPYIVALMTQMLEPDSTQRVLEIGTGSGYQSAVLAEIVDSVYSVEIICDLAEKAATLLDNLGYDRVSVKCGDGYNGVPEAAPFDRIIVTAAPDHIPEPLIEQLKIGGKMVLPVGDFYQELVVVEKTEDGVIRKRSIPVRFVPMTGRAMDKK
jgi:protein-L-isoaspartate(D-aspartate) O-methyltransferase